MITDCIDCNELKVLVKPGANKNEILEIDKKNKIVKVSIKEAAKNNKANIELLKFISKLLKKKVKIKRGLNSKEKTLEIT